MQVSVVRFRPWAPLLKLILLLLGFLLRKSHAAGDRRASCQADQNVEIKGTAMVQTRQPGPTAFRSVLPEDIGGGIE
jgi:hypothetical protein